MKQNKENNIIIIITLLALLIVLMVITCKHLVNFNITKPQRGCSSKILSSFNQGNIYSDVKILLI